MRITDTIIKWLEIQEWDERPEINEEAQTSSTGFIYSIGDDLSVSCYFEAIEDAGLIKFFMYYMDSTIPESRLDEALKFVNYVNMGISVGHLAIIPDKGYLSFRASIDVEDALIEPAHINNLVEAGVRAMENRLPQFMEVCFSDKTAEVILEAEL